MYISTFEKYEQFGTVNDEKNLRWKFFQEYSVYIVFATWHGWPYLSFFLPAKPPLSRQR